MFHIATQYVGQIIESSTHIIELINSIYNNTILEHFLKLAPKLYQGDKNTDNNILVIYLVYFIILYLLKIVPKSTLDKLIIHTGTIDLRHANKMRLQKRNR